MYPHERSLVKRLQGAPFALLGINSDRNRTELKKVLAEEKITWRSWWDESTNGPIATQWKVDGWPTIFVLDTKGIIRYQDVRGKALDEAVDRLLKEAGVQVPVPKEEAEPEVAMPADGPFAGRWVNVDDQTGGLTRIEIVNTNKGWTIQAWAPRARGAGGRSEIDWGKVALRLLGNSVGAREMKYGFASWDHTFKDAHLTLRLEQERLIVENFSLFKDNSDRSNYLTRYEFKKSR